MKKLILSAFVSLGLLGLPAPSYAFNCLEYKTFASNLSGKEAAKDAPSWVRQARLRP